VAEAFGEAITVAVAAGVRPGDAPGGDQDRPRGDRLVRGAERKGVGGLLDRLDAAAVDVLYAGSAGVVPQDAADIGRAVGDGKDAAVFFDLAGQAALGEELDDGIRAEGVEGVPEKFAAVGVGADEFIDGGLVCQVAAAAAGLEELAAQGTVAFDDADGCAGLPGMHRRHQSRRPAADNRYVKRHFQSPIGLMRRTDATRPIVTTNH